MSEDLIDRGALLLREASQSVEDVRAWILQVRQEAEELRHFAAYMEALADSVERKLETLIRASGT